MKTMLSVDGKKIIRISNEKARKLYSEGFRFIPKSEWKEKVRDVDKPKPTEEAQWGLAVIEDSLWNAVPKICSRFN